MWQFMDNHPAFAAVVIAGISILVLSVVLLIIKGKVKKAKFFGNEVEFGGSNDGNNDKKMSETEVMRDTLILCNSLNQWQKQVDKQIEAKTKEVITTSIRFANTKIDNNINLVKLDYGNYLKSKKKELTQEDNYQIIIFGFLLDQIREELKDIICAAIREDHFEEKTQAEIESIGENATIRAQMLFDSKEYVLNKVVMDSIREKNAGLIKQETNEIIKITSDKYKKLKQETETIIKEEEGEFKKVLKLKFPNISEEGIDNIVNYYN